MLVCDSAVLVGRCRTKMNPSRTACNIFNFVVNFVVVNFVVNFVVVRNHHQNIANNNNNESKPNTVDLATLSPVRRRSIDSVRFGSVRFGLGQRVYH